MSFESLCSLDQIFSRDGEISLLDHPLCNDRCARIKYYVTRLEKRWKKKEEEEGKEENWNLRNGWPFKMARQSRKTDRKASSLIPLPAIFPQPRDGAIPPCVIQLIRNCPLSA